MTLKVKGWGNTNSVYFPPLHTKRDSLLFSNREMLVQYLKY